LKKHVRFVFVFIAILPFILAPFSFMNVKADIVYAGGSITVEEMDLNDDNFIELIVKTDVFTVAVSQMGTRVFMWYINGTRLELAANSGLSGPLGSRNPLWDWLPSQPWPGELALANFTYSLIEISQDNATLKFEYTCKNSPVDGIKVAKYLTFYAHKYYVDMKIVLENTALEDRSTAADWDPDIGYCINWASIIGTDRKNDYQAFRLDGRLEFGKQYSGCCGANRFEGLLQWAALYDVSEYGGGVGGYSLVNATNSLDIEAEDYGAEMRAEFLAVNLQPTEKVVYLLRLYGGPIDADQLTEAGLEELAEVIAISGKLSLDKYAYEPNSNFTANITLTSKKMCTNVTIDIILQKGPTKIQLKRYENITLQANATRVWTDTFNVSTYDLGEGNFPLRANVYMNNSFLFTLENLLIVVSTANREPLYIAFVWHQHQPLYLNPQGVWEQPWAVYHNDLYYWHVQALEMHPSVNVTINLQPVLLYQWNLTKDGWIYNNISQSGESSRLCLEGYRNLTERGQVEILTSPFYHPIMSILYNGGWEDDAVAQIEMGKETTWKLIGVDATGAWTPEMNINTHVIPIYNQTGITHTVLDPKALGDKSLYKPYIVKDTATNKTMIAFFRHAGISGSVGFNWNKLDAEIATRRFVDAVARIYRTSPTEKKILTIAADGENWMLWGSPSAPLFLEGMYAAIEQLDWLKSTTLTEALKIVPPTEVIEDIPECSWAEPNDIWNNTDAKNQFYRDLGAVRNMVVAYGKALTEPDAYFREAINDIYVAETSDWTFALQGTPGSWFYEQGYAYINEAASIVFGLTKLYSNDIRADGKTFYVHVLTNSTMLPYTAPTVTFNQTGKKISLRFDGGSFCNVTIPVELLDGGFLVLIDGVRSGFTLTVNATHSFLYLTYGGGIHEVEIIGTTVIPEFPATPIYVIAVATIISWLFTEITKRKRSE